MNQQHVPFMSRLYNNPWVVGSAVALFVFAALLVRGCSGDGTPIVKQQKIPTRGEHVVSRGEFLNYIADNYRVHRATMLLANEEYLKAEYDRICGDKPSAYRNNPRRRGLFCNDQYRRPYGNTLVPGMRLLIPIASAPLQIQEVVAKSTGQEVALVIDETGSMGNDIATVSNFYSAALYDQEKELIGIWLYSDGQIRKVDPAGFVEDYNPGGQRENTYGALKAAADVNPDTIVLVTDEPGDDWPWLWRWGRPLFLPKVVATCLPDQGSFLCEDSLKRLAAKTGGEYVAYRP